ncbi:MAG: glycosyltransferase [Flavobacteriales bacterium]|nr:Undecaprenyl-phosphate 4-deoxy-4-formamido-L-arabinose transferase [Flavobacteriales bacterium]MCC6576618.1 glycosyltransferase [Flavobacteriales bacterium]
MMDRHHDIPAEAPGIAVVIPCYNDGAFLREALHSVHASTTAPAELVVVDDGSDDPATRAVLDAVHAEGVPVVRQEHRGLPAARNTGWRATKAPFVLFLDADNRVAPHLVARLGEALMQGPEADVLFTDLRTFGDREGVVHQQVPALAELLAGNRIDACAALRRALLERLGGYDEALVDGYEDWELWVRATAAGARFVHIPEPLFDYRVRAGSLGARADEPGRRARIVQHVVDRHAALFAANAGALTVEMHRIQAHDRALRHRLEAAVQQAGREADAAREEAARAAGQAAQARALAEEARTAAERARADADRAEHEARALAAAHDGLAERAAALEADKELLAAEAHRLVGEVDKALQALSAQREHGRALQALIGQYEARIKAIEGSRLWRLRLAYHKMLALLRTSSDTSGRGFKWLRRGIFLVSGKGRRILRKFLAKVFRSLYLLTEERPVRILVGEEQQQLFAVQGDPYHQWMARHFARPSDLRDQAEHIEGFAHRPLISVVMPVYDPPVHLLDAAIRSVMDQVYPHWELCIADDHSPNAEVRRCLERWMKEDDRIRVVFRKENGHIARASNSALELAQGTFTALMDHDDLLAPDALYHVVKRLQRAPDLDLVYTDEDKIDEQGRHSEAHFKPQWCPDHLLSRNYFGHLVVLRTTLLREVGGFRPGFEGSQDYDLLLRVTERTDRIAHIPRVLYHWRIHAGSAARSEEVKPYAYDAAKRALTEALDRRGEPAEVGFLEGFRGYGIRFTAPLKGKVSVLIPTKDKAEVLGTCLRSLFALTDHPDLEVIVVSNNSREGALFELLDDMAAREPERFRWYRHDVPFNFSGLMNFGASKATGDHLCYLNNDTEVIHADWLRTMHSWSQRPSTGAVGVKLLYPNDTIQHAGVVIGLGGVAGHTFVGYHKDGPGYFNYINTINNYSAVTAACMMVERRKLERIGGWEEAFSVEYNDVDLCLRLREAGYHNVYLPHVSLYHFESLTRGHPHMTKESYERHLREVALFQERWRGYVDDDPCYNPNLGRGVHDWQFAL